MDCKAACKVRLKEQQERLVDIHPQNNIQQVGFLTSAGVSPRWD